jgi:hypothetical protein
MSTQSNHSSSPPLFGQGPTGSKTVEQGTWMYYDQASTATGKSEKTLKRYVKKGDLKWRRMGKQINSPIQVWITPELIASVGGELEEKIEDPDICDVDTDDVDFSPEQDGDEAPQQTQEAPRDAYERMVKLMVGEFTVQLDRQREVLFEMRKELEDKDAQLRLIPDLQKQIETKEREAHLKTAALEKQVEALQANLEQQGKVVEELNSDKETRGKVVEELTDVQSKLAKQLQDLEQENEKLRAEAEMSKSKKGWWGWFLGRS